MICPNCSAYFVRYPCPECSFKPEAKIEENEKEEDDETTIRPSQLKGRSVFAPEEKEEEVEHNVSPSQILKQQREESEGIPTFQRFDKDIPSEVKAPKSKLSEPIAREAKEEDIPSFVKYEQEEHDGDVKGEMQQLSNQIQRAGNQDKLKNDVKYRKRVKSTLEEVMDLLEKLIEE